MKTKTRLLYTTWLSRQAELNHVDESTVIREKQFTVDPSVQQILIDKQRESSAFLGQINIVPVDEASGEKLGLGVAGTLAGRTDTNARFAKLESEHAALKGDIEKTPERNYSARPVHAGGDGVEQTDC